MSSEEQKSCWFTLKAGAIGTLALGFVGYLGHAAIQIASAPRDTVAYDFIQSATGLLRGDGGKAEAEAKPEPKAEPARIAAAPVVPPPDAPAPAAPAPQPDPSPAPAPQAKTPAAPSDGVARTDPALDKAARGARETGEMAARLQEKLMAERGAKLVFVRHDESASLCGSRYGVEVYPVSRAVVLKPDGAATFIRLGVGQTRDLAPGCRVALRQTKAGDVGEADLEQVGGG